MQIGLTALHKACETDNITIVKYLVAAGCNQVIDAQTTVRLAVVIVCTMHGTPLGPVIFSSVHVVGMSLAQVLVVNHSPHNRGQL